MPPLAPDMTVAQARRALADAFRQADLDSPELDARLLVGHALGLDHTGLTIEGGRELGDDVARALTALAAVDQDGPRNRALRIVDLGTGSGALLVALLSELPNTIGIGTDISREALGAARDNAGRLGLGSRAAFAACDFGAALGGHFDLVVSNPPYVASGDIDLLAAEVRHDPRRALDGGADGIACYRTIAGQARNLLKPAGHLVVELGLGQEPAVAALFRSAGLAPLPARPDLSGVPRALRARVATMTP
jgi:release factor glutamine methyltransferase